MSMFGISPTQIANMLQNMLMLLGAGLVAKGVMSGDQLLAIASGIGAVLVVTLNLFTHHDALQSAPPTVQKVPDRL